MAELFRTLIMPVAVVAAARDIAASLGSGWQGMWTTPLSPNGIEPATHYISSGMVPVRFAQIMPIQTWAQAEDGAWIKAASLPGSPASIYGFLMQRNVTAYSLPQIEAIMSAADITEQEPYSAMARLGVQIISPPLNTIVG